MGRTGKPHSNHIKTTHPHLDFRAVKESGGFAIESFRMNETTHYACTVCINFFEGIEISLVYRDELFTHEGAAGMAGHFKRMIEKMSAQPCQPVREIDILTGEEKNQLLVEFNQTSAGYPCQKTLQQLFTRQAEQTPDRTALVGGNPKSQIPNKFLSLIRN